MTGAALAALVGGALEGPDRAFSGVAPLERAGPDELAFALGAVPEGAEAGVLLARAPIPGRTVVVVADPRLALARALAALYPEVHPSGVAEGACVHPSAILAPGVVVYPGVWVGPGVSVGEGTVLFPNVVLYPGTRIGRRCRIHAGAVIGADGFAYQPGPEGLVKLPHIGGVRIEDDVEIGANSTVDRGLLGDTVIGAGSKIDNLVQVGHNVRLGRSVVLAAQVGLSGSVALGDGVVMAGQSGVADHVKVGAGAVVGAQSGVTGNLEAGGTYLGSPAVPARLARRIFAVWRRLPEWWRTEGDR